MLKWSVVSLLKTDSKGEMLDEHIEWEGGDFPWLRVIIKFGHKAKYF